MLGGRRFSAVMWADRLGLQAVVYRRGRSIANDLRGVLTPRGADVLSRFLLRRELPAREKPP